MTSRLDTPWWEEARRLPLASIAPELGLQATKGHGLTPCPACKASQRGSDDKRGPIYAGTDGGWRCLACDAGGSSLDLVAYQLTGARLQPRTPASSGPVRAWYALRGWCAPDPRAEAPQRLPVARVPVPPPAPPEPPKRATAAELEALWTACRPVGDDHSANLYFRARAGSGIPLDAWRLEDLDAVRVLPRAAAPDLPKWSTGWGASGHRLIVRLFDSQGRFAGVRARYLGTDKPSGPKSMAPAGLSAGGLVLACPLTRQILQTGARPDWWPRTAGLVIVLVEGEPDWWRMCTRYGDAEPTAPAVLGLTGEGAWTADIAARIPDGSTVITWTDPDPAGKKYADKVRESLGNRCRVKDRPDRGGSDGRT